MEVNVVDTVDPGMHRIVMVLRDRGQSVLEMPGMSHGVGYMVTQVTHAARPGSIEVLRIYSHGHAGAVNVSGGQVEGAEDWAGIDLSNVDNVAPVLARLAPYFAPQARVELYGCLAAKGSQGEQLIVELSRIWNVRVQAQTTESPIGSIQFMGAVVEANPGGGLRTVVRTEVTDLRPRR